MFEFPDGWKKNTASPETLLVPLVKDTLSYWHVSVLWWLFFVTYVPLQLWVAIGAKVNYGDA